MKRYLWIVVALCAAFPSYAQQSEELKKLAREAGIVFSGEVILIQAERAAATGEIGIVRVSFRVTDGLRGATTGQVLTISEWAGLWTMGDRYRIGETLVLFLYPPSDELGLTTTVSGPRGHVPLSEVALPLSSLLNDCTNDSAASPDGTQPHRPFRQPFRVEPAN